jgi:outer membrane immunogenic protein
MRRFGFALLPTMLAGLGFGQTASAADLGVVPFRPPPQFSWTGCYGGLNAGGGWTQPNGVLDSYSRSLEPIVRVGRTVPEKFDLQGSGVSVGGQFGCNWQAGPIVFGVETDIQGNPDPGIRAMRTFDLAGPFPFAPSTSNAEDKLGWFGTVRGRLGFTLTDSILLYGTGGFAYGGVSESAAVWFSPSTSGTFTGSSEVMRAGWTVGGGAEFALFAGWSVKLEYLYVDLGKTTVQLTDPQFPGEFLRYSFRHRENIARLGLNWRFGGAGFANY